MYLIHIVLYLPGIYWGQIYVLYLCLLRSCFKTCFAPLLALQTDTQSEDITLEVYTPA